MVVRNFLPFMSLWQDIYNTSGGREFLVEFLDCHHRSVLYVCHWGFSHASVLRVTIQFRLHASFSLIVTNSSIKTRKTSLSRLCSPEPGSGSHWPSHFYRPCVFLLWAAQCGESYTHFRRCRDGLWMTVNQCNVRLLNEVAHPFCNSRW